MRTCQTSTESAVRVTTRQVRRIRPSRTSAVDDRSTARTVRSWGVATFAWGPASIRLYPHGDLPADAVVDELRAQATLASEHGFAGVMVSERHGGPGLHAEPASAGRLVAGQCRADTPPRVRCSCRCVRPRWCAKRWPGSRCAFPSTSCCRLCRGRAFGRLRDHGRVDGEPHGSGPRRRSQRSRAG